MAAAVVVPDGDAPAYAADPTATVQLEKARGTVTAPRRGRLAHVDLGVHVTAGTEVPFRVEVKRANYRSRLTAALNGTPLPAGSASEDWAGLTKFLKVEVTNVRGRVVARRDITFCPNSYEQVRRFPDAPDSSPYPYGCRASSFGFGQVWGIERGFSTPALPDGVVLPLPVGTYTAKVSIGARWVQALGLETGTTQTVRIKVVKARRGEGLRSGTPGAGAGMHRMHHGRAPMRHTEATWGDLRRSAAFPTPSERAMEALPEVTAAAQVPDGTALPDLRSLPAWGMQVDRGRYLQFSATVWNAGPSRLVVDGFRTDDDPVRDADLRMSAHQYFYDQDGTPRGQAEVGQMEWDPQKGHNHWHFTDFARYELRTAGGRNLVVKSSKEAFCLANTDVVDFTLPGADWRPENTDLHTSCGRKSSMALRQVLDAGGGDTYMQYLPGQSFDLKNVPNGRYVIRVEANPDRGQADGKYLYEADYANNVADREVVIGGKAGKRTVSFTPVGIVAEPGQYEDW